MNTWSNAQKQYYSIQWHLLIQCVLPWPICLPTLSQSCLQDERHHHSTQISANTWRNGQKHDFPMKWHLLKQWLSNRLVYTLTLLQIWSQHKQPIIPQKRPWIHETLRKSKVPLWSAIKYLYSSITLSYHMPLYYTFLYSGHTPLPAIQVFSLPSLFVRSDFIQFSVQTRCSRLWTDKYTYGTCRPFITKI